MSPRAQDAVMIFFGLMSAVGMMGAALKLLPSSAGIAMVGGGFVGVVCTIAYGIAKEGASFWKVVSAVGFLVATSGVIGGIAIAVSKFLHR